MSRTNTQFHVCSHHTAPSIEASRQMLTAWYITVTQAACVSVRTDTGEGVDTIQASSSIVAGRWETLIDVSVALGACVAWFTITCVMILTLDTHTIIVTRLAQTFVYVKVTKLLSESIGASTHVAVDEISTHAPIATRRVVVAVIKVPLTQITREAGGTMTLDTFTLEGNTPCFVETRVVLCTGIHAVLTRLSCVAWGTGAHGCVTYIETRASVLTHQHVTRWEFLLTQGASPSV